MSESHSRNWEALSLVYYPPIRNVQQIEIYSVNKDRCWPIQNWVAKYRRNIPRYELRSNGMQLRIDDPLMGDFFTVKPEFVVHLLGDMLSTTEMGLLTVIYPRGTPTEFIHIAEPAFANFSFDVDIRSWNMNNNVEPIMADPGFLTPQKEQQLLDLASRWIVSRRAAWNVQEGDGPVALNLLGPELRELSEKSMEKMLAYEENESGLESILEEDDEEDLYSAD